MNGLLKLYPAAYRREFGDEIADAYGRATDGADRRARTREALDVVGHALRMRLGLSSAGRAGRMLAAVAPFAVVLAGLNAMLWSRLALSSLRVTSGIGEAGPVLLAGVPGFVTLLGAVVALTGRWAAGAWTVLAGTVAAFAAMAFRPGFGPGFAAVVGGLPLLAALAAVLCPPDLRPAPRLRTVAGVAAVSAGAVALTVVPAVSALPSPLGTLFAVAPAAGGLLLAGRPAFARLRTASAVLVVGLPLVVLVTLTGALGAPGMLLGSGLLVAAATVVGVRRRRAGSLPPV
ncbi:hypothetical protein [Streptomyces sp. SPB4]|uniref:hypothetical protein n=1 Tax=Streptomyces sp. SPB4 TaxID=2940553 RepID=UPI0024759A68|nr:hypothetical protein [Streptomyces sp. SPB4]MDH6544791.1 hypothetical protein [Streptomyces sp. SPB4]